MAIPASGQYPQYSGSLIHPKVSMDLVDLFYCTSIYPDISTTEYTGELNKCGDQITFFREPEVTVRDYQKNKTLVHDTFEAAPVTMIIDKAKYFSVKVDKIDQKQICNWPKWEKAIVKRASYRTAQVVDTSLLASMYPDIDPANRGDNAGVLSGEYDLGVTGAPILITSANIIQYLSYLHGVLDEQCAPQEGRFVILPAVAKTILLNSDLKAAYMTGSTSTLLNGRLPNEVMGFRIYVSNNVASVFDAGVGDTAHYPHGANTALRRQASYPYSLKRGRHSTAPWSTSSTDSLRP